MRRTAKTDNRSPHGGTIDNPRLVAPSVIDRGRFANAVQHAAAGSAAYRVSGDESGALDFALLDQRPGFLEPVGDEVGTAGHAAFEYFAEAHGVVLSQQADH